MRSESASAPRAALTTNYFLLAGGEHSRWHRVVGEEAWHFYEGDPLELLWVEPRTWGMERRMLGPPDEAQEPAAVVPAGHWQSAISTGDYSLVGCTMGPGFDDADFGLLADQPELADQLRAHHPEHAHLI